MSNLVDHIGQLFIIGFSGEKPSPTFLNFVGEEDIGGVILFKDNCPTHQDTKINIDRIKETNPKQVPFIAVDQEGGQVCRIAGAPAEYLSAWEYSEKYGLERFQEAYSRSLLFIESLGVNLNLAPVCDIFLNEKNGYLKERCFGDTADKVIPFIKAAVEISNKNGILSCLKHFPGLGASEIDPHKIVSSADYDEFVWEQREKLTFAAGVKQGADMIMTTHLRLPKIDEQITTGSKKIITDYLRKLLCFDGPVITDDLTMKGAEGLGNLGERAVVAFNAGHDLLLFGQDIDASMEAFDYFREAFIRKEISEEQVKTSLERVAGIKFKLGKSILL